MVYVLQLVVYKDLLVHRVHLHLDHVADALIDHQLLMAQWLHRKRGNCPTTYIMFAATKALLLLP